MASDSHGMWRPNPPRRRRDDKPPEVQAAKKPSLLTKIKASVQLARVINKARNEPMKNWKTTLGGLLGAAGPIVKPFLPPEWSWVGDALLSVGVLLVGKSAIDAGNVKDNAKK
jgi:hypothetical protein